ncbi:18322_t:CDS:2 [Rhizophagus irregularis]|nr:18322_t:CDS:2 [Rhizophagus irregularis]
MPAKLTFICVIHSVVERDSNNFIVKEAIVVVKKEDNTTMNLKVIAFFPKNPSVPKWIPDFTSGDILRFTGKFAFCKEPPHNDILEFTITEFVGRRSVGEKFNIKCRYLKTDERIDNKAKKIRKNPNVMILEEMILVNSEFQVEIQDINFITMTNTNIGSLTDNSISSLYSWLTTSSRRLSAQSMANNKNLTNISSDVQATDSNNEEL